MSHFASFVSVGSQSQRKLTKLYKLNATEMQTWESARNIRESRGAPDKSAIRSPKMRATPTQTKSPPKNEGGVMNITRGKSLGGGELGSRSTWGIYSFYPYYVCVPREEC